MQIKTDTHTHTEYCRHGTGDYAEEMILRAIELGYDSYSITEHAPMPREFLEESPTSKLYDLSDFNMAISDLEHYLKNMHALKEKYKSDIQIKVGFEIDFIEEYTDYNKDFLNEYGKLIDDSIISIHFLEGVGGLRSIDYSPEDFQDGLLNHYGSFDNIEKAYYDLLKSLLESDLGLYKPKRIGHITIYRKFEKYDFNLEEIKPATIPEDIIKSILENNISLDYNLSGYSKSYLKDSYPPENMVRGLLDRGLILVPGSDAHGVNAILNRDIIKDI